MDLCYCHNVCDVAGTVEDNAGAAGTVLDNANIVGIALDDASSSVFVGRGNVSFAVDDSDLVGAFFIGDLDL